MHKVYPIPARRLREDAASDRPRYGGFHPCGKYVDECDLDVTGLWVSGAVISARDMSMQFTDTCAPSERETGRVRRRIARINLFRRSAGWSAMSPHLDDLETIVSVEWGKTHHYAISVVCMRPTLLDRTNARTEPRLRPLTYIEAIAPSRPSPDQIVVRGKPHPLHGFVFLI